MQYQWILIQRKRSSRSRRILLNTLLQGCLFMLMVRRLVYRLLLLQEQTQKQTRQL